MKKEGLTETLNVKTILLSLLMLLLPPGELFLFYFMNDTDTGSFLTGFITLGMLLLVFVFVFLMFVLVLTLVVLLVLLKSLVLLKTLLMLLLELLLLLQAVLVFQQLE